MLRMAIAYALGMTLFVFVIRPAVRRLLSWRTTWTPDAKRSAGIVAGIGLAAGAVITLSAVLPPAWATNVAMALIGLGLPALVIYAVRDLTHGMRDCTNDNRQRAEWLRAARAQRDADMGMTEAEARARGYYGPQPRRGGA